MSSGGWYDMRRKAEAAGTPPATFDKLARTIPGYKQAKRIVQLKRAMGKAKEAGKDTQGPINAFKEFLDDLPPDIDIGWGTP